MIKFTVVVFIGFALLAGISPFLISNTNPAGETDARLQGSAGKERIEILVQLTEAYLDKAPKKALAYGREALALLHSFPDPKRQVTLLNYISKANASLGEFQAAKNYALQGRDIARDIGYKIGEADALIRISQVDWNQGDYNQAGKNCYMAGKLYTETGDQKGLAATFRMLGSIYWRMADLSRALDYALKSAEIYGKLNDLKGITRLEMLISRIYSAQGQYEKALEYSFKAKKAYEELADENGIAFALNNIGRDYRRLGNHAVALEYLKKSSAIFREMDAKQRYSYTLNNIGEVYADMKDYRRAQEYFSKSLEIKEAIKDRMGTAFTLINIGRSQRNLGQYNAAIQTLLRALRIAGEINIKNEIRNTYKELAETFEALKNYPKALEYYKKYKDVNDSIFNEENNKKIAELHTQYETEKKEKEIAILKKNREIQQLALVKQRNLKIFFFIVFILVLILAFVIYIRYRLKIKVTRELSKEIEDRKKVRAELLKSQKLEAVGILADGMAHDFNNLLTIIIGNLSLAEEDLYENREEAAKNLKAAEKASLQASELSQKLITLSRGGWMFPRETALSDILASAMNYDPGIKPLVQNFAIPPGLKPVYGDERQLRQVIYNLLKNAAEATNEPKPVTIRANNIFLDKKNNFSLKEGHYVKVSITDSGRGIPPDQLGKIFDPYFSTKGDVTQKGRGLGLAICYSVISKHNGHITVKSKPGKGTTVEIYLPAYIENSAADDN